MARVGIYKIESPTGKVYIGSSRHIERRWKSYQKLSCKDQPAIYNSLKKHGSENHKFSVLLECGETELLQREQLYMDIYSPELNSCKFASRPSTDPKVAAKISASLKGNKNCLGKQNALGTVPTDENKRKKSIKASGISDIQQFDLDCNLIAEYKSIFDAGIAVNRHRSNISKAVRGIRKTCAGYVWKEK